MGNLFDALKAGAKATFDALGPGPYAVAGRQVRCPHCEGRTFRVRHVPIPDVGSILPFSAIALICDDCGHVTLFDRAPDRL